MNNDNNVKIGINMDHRTPDAQLSKASLDVEYPSMDRDVANVLQFEIALTTMLRIVRMAVAQCVETSPENLPIYFGLLADVKEELEAIKSVANSAPSSEDQTPRGVIR